MDLAQARKDAEGLRYRLGVQLAAIARAARAEGRPDVLEAARLLREQVEAVEVGDEATGPEAARAALEASRPRVRALEEALGIAAYGAPVMPKWIRLATWTVPLLLFMAAFLVIFERRRRKKAIDERALEALDRAGGAS